MPAAVVAGAARRQWRARSWAIPLACLAAVALFWPCLRYGFAMDDYALIEAGRAPLRVGLPAHFVPHPGIHYRPLGQYGYFWLANQLFAYAPLPYHVANLLLHLVNVVLAGWLLARLVTGRLAAGLATLFFATHSALFLVLAWVALAGEVLPLLCMLAALACYARYLERGGWGWLAGALLAVATALLSKQVAVALPLALLLYQLLLHPTAKRLGRWPVPVAPSALLLLAPLAPYGWFVLRVSGSHESGPYHLVFDAGALRTALTYALWVVDLPRLADPYPLPLLGVALAGGVALLGYGLWRRDRVLLFGLSWFGVLLGPVVFLPEHLFHYYLYAPLFGAAVVAGRLVADLLAWLPSGRVRGLCAGVIALGLLAGNAVGLAAEREHDPTMAQAAEGQRALAVLQREHPAPTPGTTFHFVAPAEHIYYVLGYGAAVRLAYPGTPLAVTFAGQPATGPHSPSPRGPVYRYRWDGTTLVAAPQP